MKRLMTIVGARPQFIKASIVSKALIEESPGVKEIIVDTGQHYDASMNKIFFEELKIPTPGYSLGVGSGGHGEQTGKMLIELEKLMKEQQPDGVMVYGDTNSTLAGALAAAKLHIPIFHVESGLRSFNKRMPEEVNRILTDHMSDLLFTPTDKADENLRNEGVAHEKIFQVGDVMFDSSTFYGAMPSLITAQMGLQEKNYILVTIHRAENTDDRNRLENIVRFLNAIAQEISIVFPLHPRTKKQMELYSLNDKLHGNIIVTQPLGYIDMLSLEKQAKVIITDSGGVQKEAYFQKVPCFTLRDETEWAELIDNGWNTLVSPDCINSNVVMAVLEAVPGTTERELYGGGRASQRIAHNIVKFFRK